MLKCRVISAKITSLNNFVYIFWRTYMQIVHSYLIKVLEKRVVLENCGNAMDQTKASAIIELNVTVTLGTKVFKSRNRSRV